MDVLTSLIGYTAVAIPGVLAYRALCTKAWGLLAVLYIALSVATVWVGYKASLETGSNGVGWSVVIYALCLPAWVGLGLGAVIGALRPQSRPKQNTQTR